MGSNLLYREGPLRLEGMGLSAPWGDEVLSWRVKHDRDAFNELWLLFENGDGRFPLYPGERRGSAACTRWKATSGGHGGSGPSGCLRGG